MKKLLLIALLMPFLACGMEVDKVWFQRWKNASLAHAIETRNVNRCRRLIARGANVNASSSHWRHIRDFKTPIKRLFRSLGENNFTQILELLLQAGAQLDGFEGFYLGNSISTGRTEVLKRLLRYGANPEGGEFDPFTPLQWAVLNSNLEACVALLDHQISWYKETLTLLMIHRFRQESLLARLPKDVLVGHIIPLMQRYNRTHRVRTHRVQRLLNKKGNSRKTAFEMTDEKVAKLAVTEDIRAIRDLLDPRNYQL